MYLMHKYWARNHTIGVAIHPAILKAGEIVSIRSALWRHAMEAIKGGARRFDRLNPISASD